jgi:hypothetical protein
MRTLPSLLALLALPVAPLLQTHPLVGQWAIAIPTMIRGSNGLPTDIVHKGIMKVSLAGDSIVATVQMDPLPGVPARKEQRFVGPRSTGTVRLTTVTTATLVGNGDEMTRQATTTMVLTVKADSVSGTQQTEIPGIPDVPDRKVSGARVSGQP